MPSTSSSPYPYRDDIDALRERRNALAEELARTRAQTAHLADLRTREEQLARELATIEARLGAAPKRALPLLDQVRVASPCSASWDDMVGDERVRFCKSCEKNVFNLSAMSREEAEALLRQRLGSELCVRFYQRADGTILTEDCPAGVRRKRRKKLALAAVGAGAFAAAAATLAARTTCGVGHMGAVAYQGGVEPVVPTPPPQVPQVDGKPAVPVMGAPALLEPPPPKMGRVSNPRR